MTLITDMAGAIREERDAQGDVEMIPVAAAPRLWARRLRRRFFTRRGRALQRRLDVRVEPGDPSALRGARRAVMAQLHHWGLGALGETTALLTSELITNALLYSGGPGLLTALPLVNGVRLEVRDSSAMLPNRWDADEGAVSGRGLMLVEALAQSWGVEPEPDGDGKQVWCEIFIETG
ncbi:ATP-binding protein [Streptomyces sp. NPDC057257]|uniref:ATP-binding protein n=1 Tax=Streptomyces sp. NPDC057257 TaxID=3346071 RepID=UPI00363386A0